MRTGKPVCLIIGVKRKTLGARSYDDRLEMG